MNRKYLKTKSKDYLIGLIYSKTSMINTKTKQYNNVVSQYNEMQEEYTRTRAKVVVLNKAIKQKEKTITSLNEEIDILNHREYAYKTVICFFSIIFILGILGLILYLA